MNPHVARLRSDRAVWMVLLCLGLLGTVSACATAGSTTSATSAPAPSSAATRILDQAKSAGLADATFTIALTQTSDGVTVTGTGTGKLTTNPQRFASTFRLTNGSLATEQVIDIPSKTTYLKFDQPPAMATTKFDKGAGTEGVPDIQQALVYYHLTTATLVGAERVNGVSVWHLHGTFPEAVLRATDQADVYLRQDSYLPVKVEVRSTDQSVTDEVFLFTAVNTGVSIVLPTPDQIRNP